MKNAQQYWSKHIAAIQSQRITTIAYARRHDLALATLYYWQRKLRPSTTGGTATIEPTVGLRRSSKFIALSIGEPTHDVARSGTLCTLVLSSGMRLEMSALPDPQWLAAVGRSQGVC